MTPSDVWNNAIICYIFCQTTGKSITYIYNYKTSEFGLPVALLEDYLPGIFQVVLAI